MSLLLDRWWVSNIKPCPCNRVKKLGLLLRFLLENFEKDGERYPRIRNIFFQGFYEYYGAVRSVSKFIGGIKHSRHHVGQEYKDNPLKTVDIELQNEALNFYKDYIFDKNAFSN